MAKSNSYRTITTIDGTEMIFFPKGFKNTVDERLSMDKKNGLKTTQASLFNSISEEVHKSYDSIRAYYRGLNGPDDLDTVKLMATFLSVSFMAFLRPRHIDVPTLEPMDDEKSFINQMYKQIIDFVYDFIGEECSEGGVPGNEDGYTYAMMEARTQSLYRFLDKGALSIRPETYKKLRRVITECATYDGPGTFVPRWCRINQRITDAAAVHEMLTDGSSELDDNYANGLLEPIMEDLDVKNARVPYLKELIREDIYIRNSHPRKES